MTEALWLTEADVAGLMDMGEAIDALENGLAMEARGEAENMVKTHATWGKGDTLHAIGAIFPNTGFVGTKTWTHTEGGATPLLILFDSHNGLWASSCTIGRRRVRPAEVFPIRRGPNPGFVLK